MEDMTDLFDIPESKSPRLLWMERYRIVTHKSDVCDNDKPWMAWRKKDENANGIPRIGLVGEGETEHDAIVDCCLVLGIRLWNEEGRP